MTKRRAGGRLEPLNCYNPYRACAFLTEKELRKRYGDNIAEAVMREDDTERPTPPPPPPPVRHALSLDWQPEADRHLAECSCGWLSPIDAWAFATEAAAKKEAERRFEQHMKGA